MLTQTIQNFAPDGLSGGRAPVQGRFDGSQRDRREFEVHQNHDHDYDDGLVHSHSWASASCSQPVRPFHNSARAAV